MMVAPLLREERTLGVLSVLDRGRTGRSSLQELELLTAFAGQAALALDVTEAARRAAAALDAGAGSQDAALIALARGLRALDGPRRAAADRLVAALTDLLAA
jgi:GAF domain-containing protein